ncbi:MAG: DsbA family protein [Acidimicrobiia bacterium]|nr:DsbA family protein [Acidimicrobiia bacterium]
MTTTGSPSTPIVDIAVDREFIYVGDPMCSWCHGFAPVVKRVGTEFGLPVRVKVGGLRAFENSEPLGERLKGFLSAEWARIGEVTGQPFSTTALEREGWVYDTGPADQAVVAARNLEETSALDYFTALQHAFYAEGRDITQREVLLDVAEESGFDRAEFGTAFDTAHDDTLRDFAETRSWGVTGYPTLLIRTGDELVRAAAGYVSFDNLKPQLSAWFDKHAVADQAPAMMCDVETGLC